jgi:hypothetical protein
MWMERTSMGVFNSSASLEWNEPMRRKIMQKIDTRASPEAPARRAEEDAMIVVGKASGVMASRSVCMRDVAAAFEVRFDR